jgi:serine protease
MTRLKLSALPFPTSSSSIKTACTVEPNTTDSGGNYTDTSQKIECVCSTATCGAGMLNADAAVQAAITAQAIITLSSSSATLGQKVTLDGTGSTAAAGRTITDWQWTASNSVSVANANQPVAYIIFPNFRPVTVTLTITDNTGASLSVSATIQPGSGSSGSSSTSSNGTSTGGGGSLGWPELALAAGLGLARLARRKKRLVVPPLRLN